MQKIVYVGLDVHKSSISVTTAEEGRDGIVRFMGTVPNTTADVTKLAKRLAKDGHRLAFCYEAGAFGYGIHRLLVELGHECTVAAPSLIARIPLPHPGRQPQIGDAGGAVDADGGADQLPARHDPSNRPRRYGKGFVRMLCDRQRAVRRFPLPALHRGSGRHERARQKREGQDLRTSRVTPRQSLPPCVSSSAFSGATGVLRRQVIDLSSRASKRIPDRQLRMIVPPFICRCAIDYNVSMWRQCEPDVNFEARTVTMVVRGDHLYTAARNALIVCFKAFYLAHDLCARRI